MSVEGVPLPVIPVPLCTDNVSEQPPLDARDALDRVVAVLEVLPGLSAASYQLSTRELTSLARDLLAVMQLCEASVTRLLADAIGRGMIADSSAANPAQWVSRLAAGESLAGVMGEAAESKGSGPLVPLVHEGAELGGAGLDDSGMNDLARPQVPGIEPAQASRIAKVATACRQPRNTLLSTAAGSGCPQPGPR